MAKKTNKNSKELSGPVKVKRVMPGKCVGIMRRRTMIKWLRTMLPRKREAKQRRVRFFDLQMLGYQRSGEEIMFLNRHANISKMRFFGLVDEDGRSASFCFLHVAEAGMGVIVRAPLESVYNTLSHLNSAWVKKIKK